MRSSGRLEWFVSLHPSIASLNGGTDVLDVVYLDKLLLLDGFQGNLGSMARAGYLCKPEVVSAGTAVILVPADPGYQHGRKEKRSLPDVDSPHHHQHSLDVRLYLRFL
jgi:hypothetical protein